MKEWHEEKVMNVVAHQDGVIHGNKVFCLNEKGEVLVYNLEQKVQLGAFLLDRIDIIRPHANSVCFGSGSNTEQDAYPLLYVNVYNNYSRAGDRLEGACCVYRLTEDGKSFSTELVQVIRIGFTESLELWKSLPDNGDVRPYGNFVVDTDREELVAFVMRDADMTTRFFRFKLPDSASGTYRADYGCNMVVLEESDILDSFDTPYMNYMQGCCYWEGKIYSVEGFNAGSRAEPVLRIIDLQAKQQVRMELLAERGLIKEPELICVENGTVYYAAEDLWLRILHL